MDRKEFIIKAGMFVSVCACAGACQSSQEEQIEPKKEEIDFTIDLSNTKFADLQKVGGFIYEKLIIIARKSESEFLAFTQYCTHSAGVIKFIPQKNHFECPVHYSKFDIEGKVIQDPAQKPLKKYQTELKGNLLRIFE